MSLAVQHKALALALFSGGLDSILACRLVAAQGIRVQALRFISPFFGYELLAREEAYCHQMREKYGIDVVLHDISEPYLAMLHQPAYGYGKNFNPCVDCKILLLSEARRLMPRYGASFLITGEVLGQRPMSQRRDTLHVIERDSGCRDILVRPLCAKKLPPTEIERAGLVDRKGLLDFWGRGRSRQIALAKEFGIDDYPPPAGGCALTDPNIAGRIKFACESFPQVTPSDMVLIQTGRQFLLPGGGWLALGRKQDENERLEQLCRPGDALFRMVNRPGPIAVLRQGGGKGDILAAAGLVVRYGKRIAGESAEADVLVVAHGEESVVRVPPLAEASFDEWRR